MTVTLTPLPAGQGSAPAIRTRAAPPAGAHGPGALTAFDDDAHPLFQLPARAQPPERERARRGRPRQSHTAILSAGGALRAQDLALLRAWAQGLPATRGSRYLSGDASGAGPAGRAAREHLAQLLARLAAAAGQLGDRAERERALQLLGAQAATAPQQARPTAPARARLTLEEFAARFDADMYSEAELIELYQQEEGGDSQEDGGAAHGGDGPGHAAAAPAAGVGERLALLERLAPQLAGRPTGRSLLASWLQPQLAAALSQHLDAPTLGALAERIAERGPAWWRAVPGLGRVRAQRLVQWLAAHERDIGVALDTRLPGGAPAHAPTEPRDLAGYERGAAASAPVVGAGQGAGRPALAPLAQLLWPAPLAGADGTFRAAGANTLGAADDRQALAAWARIHLAGKAEATCRVYLRAIERLVLWALCERGVALSSLSSADFAAFRDFLAAPPAHWCGRERVVKGSSAWRPLRGALSAGAVMQVMGVVQQLWRDWLASGYLRADAAALVPARPPRACHALLAASDRAVGAGLDVTRAFEPAQLQVMRSELAAMPQDAAQRRLRALLLLLLETGLRRSEAERLTFGAIEPMPLPMDVAAAARPAHGAAPSAWQLHVVGKRGKLRVLPLRPTVLQALQAHWNDRLALARSGALPASLLSLPLEHAPVLGMLRIVRAGGARGHGDAAAAAPRRVNAAGALAGASMHGLLKAFFARCAARVADPAQRASFERASAHWLRHTFAHRVVAAGGEQALPAAQALLGHASLATTGEYLRAQAHERLAALARFDSAL